MGNNITTVSIKRKDLDYVNDLQYIIRKNIGKTLKKDEILDHVLAYIKQNEKDFLEFVKKSISKS